MLYSLFQKAQVHFDHILKFKDPSFHQDRQQTGVVPPEKADRGQRPVGQMYSKQNQHGACIFTGTHLECNQVLTAIHLFVLLHFILIFIVQLERRVKTH